MKLLRPGTLLPGNSGLHLGLSLLLALTVCLPALQMRQALRSQFLTLQTSNLYEVLRMELDTERERIAELGQPWSELDSFAVILRSSRMTGVVGVRFWPSVSAEAICLPASLDSAPPSASLIEELRRNGSLALIHPRGDKAPESLTGNGGPDLLELNLPLPGDKEAIVQYWVAGSQAAVTLDAIDRNIARVALLVWMGTATLANLLVHLGLRRILRLNHDLDVRGRDLALANEELKLAAKSSALGTITAHLLHGLRNPVNGLRGLTHDQTRPGQATGEDAWQEAARLADRLQSMVEEVASLLRDESGGLSFEIEWSELQAQVERRVEHTRLSTGLQVLWSCTGKPPPLDNRNAGLLSLAMGNLIENALQASSAGQTVKVDAFAEEASLRIEIRDEAGGLPEQVSKRLFLPVPSSRPGGSGIGMAISRQLILQAGGDIQVRTGKDGTCFTLRVPIGQHAALPPSAL